MVKEDKEEQKKLRKKKCPTLVKMKPLRKKSL